MVSSAGMNPCTDNVEPVVDKHGVKWWDTPGFETWTPEVASTFLHDNFYKRKILPKAAIFCRTANSLGDTRVVEYMFKEFQARGILVIFVITKYPFIGVDERADIETEAFGLLGGNPVPLFDGVATECIPQKCYLVVSVRKRIISCSLAVVCLSPCLKWVLRNYATS